MILQKITPFLWFDGRAEAAAKFYTAIFKDSQILRVTRYEASGAAASGQRKGSVMTVAFQLNGQDFTALNGGPQFKFTEAVSFVVNCDTQPEIDYFWRKLSAGGKKSQCGWLKDKFGVSWQIVPAVLGELFGAADPAKSQRVMQAILQMSKLDIKKLEQAYAG
jgi:predicted 3-demethylubiquinone-9 3-methyltransferase (glyoxalase superfamily)